MQAIGAPCAISTVSLFQHAYVCVYIHTVSPANRYEQAFMHAMQGICVHSGAAFTTIWFAIIRVLGLRFRRIYYTHGMHTVHLICRSVRVTYACHREKSARTIRFQKHQTLQATRLYLPSVRTQHYSSGVCVASGH